MNTCKITYNNFHAAAAIAVALFCVTSSDAVAASRVWRAVEPVPNEYIVVLADQQSRDIDAVVDQLVAPNNGVVLAKLRNGVKAFGVRLSPSAAEALANNPLVNHVEENARVFLSESYADDTFWHLDRIDTTGWGSTALNRSYTYTHNGAGVNAYIVGTGVLGTHQDFGGRVRAGHTFADGFPANAPCGVGVFTTFPGITHDTRVASVIGGTTNGVAKGVTIIPLKVWTCDLSVPTATSNILWWCWALDWILGDLTSAENCPGGVCRRAVVNISGGFLVDVVQGQMCDDGHGGQTPCLPAFENNVAKLVQNGVPVVASANNQNNNLCKTSPARMGQGGTAGFNTTYHTITVGGSTDVTPAGSSTLDARWVRRPGEEIPGDTNHLDTGSNYGTCVDIYAPAEHFKHLATMASNSSYELSIPYQSGTSYAAPIVTGIIARLLQMDRTLTPDQIWARLRDNANHFPGVCFDPPAGACINDRFIYGSPTW